MPIEAIVHVVDDDLAVRQSLSFLLASAGLPVRLYESASAFLDGLKRASSGCVVTDVRMPGVDGLTAADFRLAAEIDEGALQRCPHESLRRVLDAERLLQPGGSDVLAQLRSLGLLPAP